MMTRTARRLSIETAETRVTYATVTALLTGDNPRKRYRGYVSRLACDLAEPENIFATLDIFPIARIWIENAEKAIKEIERDLSSPILFNTVGQILLSKRRDKSDIDILISLIKIRCQKREVDFDGFGISALFISLDVLEIYAPQETVALIPDILKRLGLIGESADSILTARVLVLIGRLNLDGNTLIRPLSERVSTRQSFRRWTRKIARAVRTFEPKPGQAHELARVLRILALERTVEGLLVRRLKGKSEAQVRRAWRWLLRSEKVIDAMPDLELCRQLHARKARLEEQVRRSRKAVHIAARTSDVRAAEGRF